MNYENLDLSKDDDLKKAGETVRENRPDWKAEIVAFLQDVQNSDEETRNSLEFQRKLWNENLISQPARQGPKVDGAIEDEEFRKVVRPTIKRTGTLSRKYGGAAECLGNTGTRRS